MTTTVPNGADMDVKSQRVTHAVVMVSSETAARWLTTNKRNRPVSHDIVDRYSNDMATGLWTFAADPIRFDTEGHLIDGQHRLTALARVEMTLPMLVVRGLPTDSQLVMDQGRKRTPGQQLGLLGVKDSNLIASIVKVTIQYDTGLLFRDNKLSGSITAPVIQEYVNDHSDEIAFVQPLLGAVRRADAPPSVVGAFAVIAARVHGEDAAIFLTQLDDLVGMSKGHPIHTLDKRLRRIRRERIKFSNRDYLALFIQAFNAWRAGRQITQFPRPSGGSWSVANFPAVA